MQWHVTALALIFCYLLFCFSVFSGDHITFPGSFPLCSGHVWLVLFFFLTLPPRSVFVERWFAPNLPVFLLQLPKAPDVCMAFIDSLKRYGGSSVLFCGLCLHNVWLSIRLPEALTPCLRNAACWLTLLAGLRGQTRLWLAGCGCSSLSVWVNAFSSIISPISMGKTII